MSVKGWLSGWQWLFLIEGLATIVFGVVFFFVYQIMSVPPTPYWLSEKEKALVIVLRYFLESDDVELILHTHHFKMSSQYHIERYNVLGRPCYRDESNHLVCQSTYGEGNQNVQVGEGESCKEG
ncbi:hypothetical protein BKA65DRAFT_477009 [Rhexocercosporidium sp. MPI-PUGE-AT-0058]|nr:hypothetical protein BKA65DRAFT_477009 [Rhexocercosporidium sp. MPI-PUGE-AT-0058]